MMRIMVRNRWYVVILMLLGLGLFACGKKMVKPTTEPETSAKVKIAPGQQEDEDNEKTELEARGKKFKQIAQLKNVYFDFDKYDLKPETRTILIKNAEWLLSNREVEILIAGHCDERGTVEYNLALGDKRAKVVRDYYYRLGIPYNRMATISYGKEKPLNPGHNEESWTKNRRAETLIKK
jgi:peptidoglycan-associated lipoprotein